MKIQDVVELSSFEQEAEELCSNVDMLDDPRMQIGAVLGYLGRKQKFRMDRELEKLGLTSTQVEVFFYIIKCNRENKTITARDLENRFRVKNSTMSGILKRLEKKELIERVTDVNDRRNKQICIKGNFDESCGGIESRIQEEFDKFFRGFSKEELDGLLQLSLKLLHNME